MKFSARGFDLIKSYEGFSSNLYHCPAGLLTIGYGHVVKDAAAFITGINEWQANQLLQKDVEIAERALQRLVTVLLTQGQYDALVSFTFNLGAARLQMSTLRQVVNRGDHLEAPKQLMRWVFAAGKKLPGLVRRRAEEAHIYQWG